MTFIVKIHIPENMLAPHLEKEGVTRDEFISEFKEMQNSLDATDLCPGATAHFEVIESDSPQAD